MYLVTFEVRPTRLCGNYAKVAGAFVNCWMRSATCASARRVARRALRREGWRLLEEVASSQKLPRNLAEGTEPFYRQAMVDGEVFVFHTWPR
jgi:hypothetical protein